MDKKVKLFFKNDLIGALSYVDNNFNFVVDDKYENEFVLNLLNFSKGKEFTSPHLFFIFDRFVPKKTRTDIYKEAKIKKEDNVFEILYKVAALNLDKDQFWIGR